MGEKVKIKMFEFSFHFQMQSYNQTDNEKILPGDFCETFQRQPL